MEILSQTHWFAIQSKAQREKLAAGSVTALDLEVYLPLAKRRQLVCGTARTVTQALFPGYFFARFCPAVCLDAVRGAHGVLRVVGTRQFPLPVASEIIEGIQERAGEDGLVSLAKTFHPGDAVTIEEGPLAGLIGRIERETEDGKRVAILLEAIHQARVVIDPDWLRLSQEG